MGTNIQGRISDTQATPDIRASDLFLKTSSTEASQHPQAVPVLFYSYH